MELTVLMKDVGIVGAGGAGFPSYAKLAEGADTLLVNGSECEPLLYTDYYILKNEMSLVLSGIHAVLDKTSLKRAVLAIKEHTAKRLSFSDGEKLSERVSIRVIPNVYPIGDEVSLVYQALGRHIQPGKLPISVGVIVYNVETMYNLGCSERFGQPVTMKWLTIGGNVKKPIVVKVPIGTAVCDLFRAFSIDIPDDNSVLDGGPSMGRLINVNTAVVTKTTKGLLILPNSTRAIESKLINEDMAIARAETACCQCTRCTDMCPRALMGYPLEPHKMVRTAMQAVSAMPIMVVSATLCCGCGICENLACSQGISPKAVINGYKALLQKNKMRYSDEKSVDIKDEREYRMIPSEKWAQTLGIAKFDTLPEYMGERTDFNRVRQPLNRQIGAAAVPIVKDGDFVKRGDRIADPAPGLSVAHHASIDGRVTLGVNEIIIDKVK